MLRQARWCFLASFVIGAFVIPGLLIAGILTEQGRWATASTPLIITVIVLVSVGCHLSDLVKDGREPTSAEIWKKFRSYY